MPAVTGGELASYLGSLVAQIASLEMEVANLQGELEAKTAEGDAYFEDLCTCARALTRIDMTMHGEKPICVGCLLGLVEAELDEAEPGYAWAIGLVAEEMAEEEELEDEDFEDVEKATDVPATELRVNLN